MASLFVAVHPSRATDTRASLGKDAVSCSIAKLYSFASNRCIFDFDGIWNCPLLIERRNLRYSGLWMALRVICAERWADIIHESFCLYEAPKSISRSLSFM